MIRIEKEIPKPLSSEERKEKIKKISEEFYKRWIIENIDDDIFIWHFLDFVGSSFLYNVDIRKEIVLAVYDSWFFTNRSLNHQLDYAVKVIYDLFFKIKICTK